MSLPGRNRNIDIFLNPPHRLSVFRRHRIFVEQQIVGLQPFADDDGVFGGEPRRTMSVDHNVHLIAYRAPDGFDSFDRPIDSAGLHAGDPAVAHLERTFWRSGMSIRAYPFANPSAEQVPYWRVQHFAFDVPQGHVDRVDRARPWRSRHSVAHDRHDHLLVQSLDIGRILTHDDVGQILHPRLDHTRPT